MHFCFDTLCLEEFAFIEKTEEIRSSKHPKMQDKFRGMMDMISLKFNWTPECTEVFIGEQ